MPLVLPWERRRLLKYRDDLVFKPYLTYRVNPKLYAVLLYRWIIKGKCPFLRENRICGIHREKPLSCKIFPLLIGLDDNTLRVSMACKVISRNPEEYQGDPFKVFPNEYPYALKTFMILKIIDEIAQTNNWRREIIVNPIEGTYIDIDELIEVKDLLKEIENRIKTLLNEGIRENEY